MKGFTFKKNDTGLNNGLNRMFNKLFFNRSELDHQIDTYIINDDCIATKKSSNRWSQLIHYLFIDNYHKTIHAELNMDSSIEFYPISCQSNKGYYLFHHSNNIQDFRQTIHELEQEYRIPFVLYMAGYNQEEIAYKLGLSVSLVENRLIKAKKIGRAHV